MTTGTAKIRSALQTLLLNLVAAFPVLGDATCNDLYVVTPRNDSERGVFYLLEEYQRGGHPLAGYLKRGTLVRSSGPGPKTANSTYIDDDGITKHRRYTRFFNDASGQFGLLFEADMTSLKHWFDDTRIPCDGLVGIAAPILQKRVIRVYDKAVEDEVDGETPKLILGWDSANSSWNPERKVRYTKSF